MRVLKAVCVVFIFLLFLVVASVVHIAACLRPSVRWKAMSYLTFFLINLLRRIVGIRIQLLGQTAYLNKKGCYFIARHIGYIDGLVMGSLTPATFVSKKEIKGWPLIGKVVAISGTIFVDRQQKSKVTEALQKILSRLARGISILAFPEGTSTDGSKVLPFQTPFFGVPIAARAAIVPVTITYQKLNGRPIEPHQRDEICWYDKMTFPRHIWNLLKYKRIDACVEIHPEIPTASYTNSSPDRKRLAQKCRETVLRFVTKNSLQAT